MQVEVDMICMKTNFGGHGLSSFRDLLLFKFDQISLLNHGPWGSKIKFYANDVKCVHIKFGGYCLFGFENFNSFHLPSILSKISARVVYAPFIQMKFIHHHVLFF